MSHGASVEKAAKERCRLSLKDGMFSRINTLSWSFISQMDKIERRQVAYKAIGRIETRSSENFVFMLIKLRSSDC